MLACDGTDWVPWAGWTVTGYPAPQFSSAGGGASAIDDLSDVDTSGKSSSDVLTWNGSTWGAAAISTTPAGSDTQIQFNDGGSALGADANFVWDKSTDRLGINDSTPEVALDVVGDINYTGQIVDVSDIRLKENVRPLDSPLTRLTTLHGIAFEMKDDPNHITEYGVSAQDVQKVFPELVHKVDADGTLGVNYNGLIAPMLEAIKEQQAQIQSLRAEIESLKEKRDNESDGK